ncbi:hypothetical protein AVEN_199999-1 [Araneus ventricosus]|uniref:Uncharacterized protein n=1 Tax=Araneus ventricosus TaxID=182803 RepID=A0A4Y2BVT3_ARAVE|nr:hypothetical protein AVEN_199999-1 [Araneus ventricosus]
MTKCGKLPREGARRQAVRFLELKCFAEWQLWCCPQLLIRSLPQLTPAKQRRFQTGRRTDFKKQRVAILSRESKYPTTKEIDEINGLPIIFFKTRSNVKSIEKKGNEDQRLRKNHPPTRENRDFYGAIDSDGRLCHKKILAAFFAGLLAVVDRPFAEISLLVGLIPSASSVGMWVVLAFLENASSLQLGKVDRPVWMVRFKEPLLEFPKPGGTSVARRVKTFGLAVSFLA